MPVGGLAGLDTPLVLSTMSLDISADDTSSLIRSYLTDANEWAYSQFRPAIVHMA